MDHVRLLVQLKEKLPPILVHRQTMRVIDGMHRLRAAVLRGEQSIEATFYDGDDAAAFMMAVRANVQHGLPLSLPDRKAAAARIVRSSPHLSDRAIAEVSGLSAKTVGAIRWDSAGQAHVRQRIGRDGRVRPLSTADGRRLAGELITLNPASSSREIARMAGISPSTVRDVRERLSRGEDPIPTRLRAAPGAGQPRPRAETAEADQDPAVVRVPQRRPGQAQPRPRHPDDRARPRPDPLAERAEPAGRQGLGLGRQPCPRPLHVPDRRLRLLRRRRLARTRRRDAAPQLVRGATVNQQRIEPATAATLFERCVSRFPAATAVEDRGRLLSYSELNAEANRLARRLLASGVGADQVVAVALPRSADQIAALLAVLKSGAAYLPLDMNYPRDRLAFMLRDASPALAITTMSGSKQLTEAAPAATGFSFLELDRRETVAAIAGLDAADITDGERGTPAHPGHAMYVIYTSGSTGTPKGVVVTGTGMAVLADIQRRMFRVAPGSRVLQWASISFDAAFWDISAALFSGATLVLAPGDKSLPDSALHDLLREGRITHATLPPAVLAVLDDDVLAGATIVSTGDSCTEAIARKWSRGRRLLNGYGPTETTVGSTISEPYSGGEVPIGRPFADTAVHLLDGALRPVGQGDVGEIYIGGPGVARGYLGQPALTAQRFVASPFEPGKRLYRTGDLASVAADGQLIFRGRADDQIKLRGFRVEPGEAESVLSQHPGVKQATVIVRDDKHLGKQLVAYVVTADCDPGELRGYLCSRLPDYLVPAAIVEVAEIPLTPNGKVDRKALPDPPRRGAAARGTLSTHEKYLCDSISELLGIDDAGPADDFFELGGHSLAAAKLIGRIRKDLGLRLPVRRLYQSSRIADLAASLAEADPDPARRS